MNKVRLTIFLILIPLVLMIGCAKVSKTPESSSDEAKLFNTLEDKGVVYLYRTGRAVGAAWELKPGTYTIASSTTESAATVQVNVELGKLYFFKQTSRMGLTQVE